jgi:hypothetical protein
LLKGAEDQTHVIRNLQRRNENVISQLNIGENNHRTAIMQKDSRNNTLTGKVQQYSTDKQDLADQVKALEEQAADREEALRDLRHEQKEADQGHLKNFRHVKDAKRHVIAQEVAEEALREATHTHLRHQKTSKARIETLEKQLITSKEGGSLSLQGH